jgi:integrase/recombinase XerD
MDSGDGPASRARVDSAIKRETAKRPVVNLLCHLFLYGNAGANLAHSDFVSAPSVPRDGKMVALAPFDCRRLLDAPAIEDDGKQIIPAGIRDRAMFAVLAFAGCRVDELVRLKVRDYRTNGEHRILDITGKGNKERATPLHIEAAERLSAWLALPGIAYAPDAPLFPPQKSARGIGYDGFRHKPMTTRAVLKLMKRYVAALGLDPNVVTHSMRVTAPTPARERGSDILDLQDYAGHADPRTTLTYIRSRDRLSKSPAYVLKY